MNELKKIVIIGPESTGKSTLCKQLAEHYNTLFCPEFAREYLLKHGMNYTYEDLLQIAKGQVALEEEFIQLAIGIPIAIGRQLANGQAGSTAVSGQTKDSKNTRTNTHSPLSLPDRQAGIHRPPLFIDTDMYVMKIWCEFVFGKCHPFILDQIIKRKYDLYLLCNVDLPWVKDELREYPDLKIRVRLFDMYKDAMINQDTPWMIISGDETMRLNTAIKNVEGLLNT